MSATYIACGARIAPPGWWCKRPVHTDGPCAAVERAWIGVDFDRTLAVHTSGQRGLGGPIAPMVKRVRGWLNAGQEVRIVTARVSPEWGDAAVERGHIREWCETHLGQPLEVQCHKDGSMIELWDDRAIGVMPNIGVRWDEVAYAIDRAVLMQKTERVLEDHGYLRREVEGETKNERLIADIVDAILKRPA